jgi:hypothetical protein
LFRFLTKRNKDKGLKQELGFDRLWHDAEVLAGATTSAAIWGTRDVVDASAPGQPLTRKRNSRPKLAEARIAGQLDLFTAECLFKLSRATKRLEPTFSVLALV